MARLTKGVLGQCCLGIHRRVLFGATSDLFAYRSRDSTLADPKPEHMYQVYPPTGQLLRMPVVGRAAQSAALP